MNITTIGSTVRNAVFTIFRVIRTDDEGRVEVVAPVGAPTEVNVAEVAGTATVDGGPAGTLGVGGPVAHGDVSTQNPVLGGAVANAAEPAAVVEGRLVQLSASLKGWLRTLADLGFINSKAIANAGLDGVLPVGGTGADGVALTAAYSVRVGALVRKVLTEITDVTKQTFLLDNLGALWTRVRGFDPVSNTVRVSTNTVANIRKADGSPDIWAADANHAVGTDSYPSTAGEPGGDYKLFLWAIDITDGTLTLKHTSDGAQWDDITPMVKNNLTGATGFTSFASVGATTKFKLSIKGMEGGLLRWDCVYPDGSNSLSIKTVARY